MKITDTLSAIAETEGTTVRRLLTATLGERRVCSRCGGTGIYSQYHGVCYKCGGQRPKWIHVPARVTRKMLAKVERRIASVRHTFRLSGWDMVKNLTNVIRWENAGGPITAAQWVKEEGERVHWKLWHIADEARMDRERIERKNAKLAAYKARDEEIGYADIPTHGRRIKVTAEVLSTREAHNGYNWVTKALLKAEVDGLTLKLWGNLPSKINRAERGDHICFDAALKPSPKDNKFGFWSRPTKAAKIS